MVHRFFTDSVSFSWTISYSSCQDSMHTEKRPGDGWITYPSANREMIMMGPKDSSLAMYMWSSTSVKMVG